MVVCSLLVTSSVASAAPALGTWRAVAKVPGILDVVGPRGDGRLVLATHGGLFLMRPGGSPVPYARGPQGYAGSPGESYIALGTGRRVRGAGCAFGRDVVFVLDPDATPGVVRIDRSGRSSRFVDLPAGHPDRDHDRHRRPLRLSPPRHVVHGRANHAPRIRLPRPGPGCRSWRSVRRGRHRSGTPHLRPLRRHADCRLRDNRADLLLWPRRSCSRCRRIGTSSRRGHRGRVGGLRPDEARSRGAAYLADMGAPGAPTSGSDSLLILAGTNLSRVNLRSGELVVATEAGAKTIAVRCARRCTVRRVADCPTVAHAEGHITFVRRR